MNLRVYLRVAHQPSGKPKVAAGVRPSKLPLYDSSGNRPIPTVAFAIDLDLPDAMFRAAERVIAELTVPESAAEVAAKVREVPE